MTRASGFSFLRLLAALLVTFSHSYPLSLGSSVVEPPYPLLDFSFGTLGVYLFFAISGILVTKSFLESRSLIHFLTYRALRIFPALIVCVLLSIFVLGATVTQGTLRAYFTDAATWSYLYWNGSLAYQIQSTLPGVFSTNPLPSGVNDSLWTLPWEIRAYLLLAVGGVILGIKQRNWGNGLLLALAVLNAGFYMAGEKPAIFLVLFFFGGFLYRNAAAFGYRFTALILLSIMGVLLYGTPYFNAVFLAWVVVFAFVIGFSSLGGGLHWLERFDLSYGLYLYSFPVGQLLVFSLGIRDPLWLFLLTVAFALPLATISWVLVEKPALNRKRLVADGIHALVQRQRVWSNA